VWIAEALLFLPMPWVFWHTFRLSHQAREDGRLFGIVYVLTAGNGRPEIWHSQLACIFGLAYFLLLGAAWILYAAWRGI